MDPHTALRIVCLCVLGALAGACGEDPKPAAAPAPSSAPAKKAAAEPSAAADADATDTAETTLIYQYNPMAKRDPFRSPDADQRQNSTTACTEPLCQWELDQLTLVGVVSGMANPFGMVEDP